MSLDIGDGGVADDVHAHGVAHFKQADASAGTRKSTRIHGRASTLGDVVGDDIPVDQPIPDDDDDAFDDEDAFAMFDGDEAFPCNEEFDYNGEDEDVPNGIILELYQEMQDLRSNWHCLDRFSFEEKVHIELLHLLKELNAPLKDFSSILKWAGKANEAGHIFCPQCQPSRTRVIHNLYCRYNMKGLIPKEKEFFLPYSRRIVTMVCFDAREVFASLLSCPMLNRNENYLFDSPEKNPFIPLTKSPIIGDINTGRFYQKTYKALVKNPEIDMILP